MKSIARIFFLACMLFFMREINAQTCGTCSVNITSLDSSNYVVNSGETFCVDTTGNFIGTITLNGGTICNNGIFNPLSITFSSGTISNNGNSSFRSSLIVPTNSQLSNNADAVMNTNGFLTMNGGTLTNSGIMNVNQSVQNTSGSISNSGIMNCTQLTGSGSLSNTGKINTN